MRLNSEKDELIAHYMRVKWYAVRFTGTSNRKQLSRFFATKKAAENTLARMGATYADWIAVPHGHDYMAGKLKYSKSWDALVPVVKQIKKTVKECRDLPASTKALGYNICLYEIGYTHINKVYKSVVTFIESYQAYKERLHGGVMEKLKQSRNARKK